MAHYQRNDLDSGPVSRVLSRRAPMGLTPPTVIYLGRQLLVASSSLPESWPVRAEPRAATRTGGPRPRVLSVWPCSGWGLPSQLVAQTAGALLPHRFTLTAPPPPRFPVARLRFGGLLSVALSRALRPVDVIDHPALRSPDFPPASLRQPTTVQPTAEISLQPTTFREQKDDPAPQQQTAHRKYTITADSKRDCRRKCSFCALVMATSGQQQ
jgi:hypothetical protein